MAPLRRTRFVCISDTHNASPADGCFKLPKGDVLIHAGDLTKQGTVAELQKTIKWMEKADHEVKIIVAGNHDVTLDAPFYTEYGSAFHNQSLQSPSAAIALVAAAPSITYLEHTSAHVRLTAPSGPHTHFRIFGSPYSPATSKAWAFTYAPEAASTLWSNIPLATDIVVAHTPPHRLCDYAPKRDGNRGCLALRDALQRVRPRMLVCGHVHEGRGVARVDWDVENEQESSRGNEWCWEDRGGSGKMSLVDVSARSGVPLKNDGGLLEKDRQEDELSEGSQEKGMSSDTQKEGTPTTGHGEDFSTKIEDSIPGPSSRASGPTEIISTSSTTVAGRKETLVVNAAIMASSWPYKSGASGRWNQPIVVDLDLPVWEEEEEEEEEEEKG